MAPHPTIWLHMAAKELIWISMILQGFILFQQTWNRVQIPYGSSIRMFNTDPAFQLEGNIVEFATPVAVPAWAGAR